MLKAARRPAGWRAPGPPPAGGEVVLGPHERLAYLTGDWRIVQRRDGHQWSMDDLVTAHLAAASMAAPPPRFCDLGTGTGSVLMALLWRFPAAHAVAVEAQALSAALCRRSLAYNGCADRVTLLDGDLREVVPSGGRGESRPFATRFGLVTGTPPYFPAGTGTESDRVQRAPARFEHRGGVDDYTAAAARILAAGGRFVMCAAHGQGPRVAAAAAAHGLAVIARTTVVPRTGKAPLIEVHVLAWEPAPTVERSLVVRDEHGQWTPGFLGLREAMGLPPPPGRDALHRR
jgi:tRNA1(Val) A37 N6-methylase TrmN6